MERFLDDAHSMSSGVLLHSAARFNPAGRTSRPTLLRAIFWPGVPRTPDLERLLRQLCTASGRTALYLPGQAYLPGALRRFGAHNSRLLPSAALYLLACLMVFACLLCAPASSAAQSPPAEPDSLYDKGVEAHQRSDTQQGIAYLQQAMEQYRQRRDTLGLARTHNELGTIYRQQGTLDQAGEHASRARELATVAGAHSQQAVALQTMGTVKRIRGKTGQALDHQRTSLELATQARDTSRIASAHNNIGVVKRNMDRYSEALEHFQKAFSLHESQQNRRGQATVMNQAGALHQEQGNYTDALQYFSQTLEIRKELNRPMMVAAGYNNVAAAHFNIGNYMLALDHFEQSLQIIREIDNRQYLSSVLNNIGFIYRAQNNLDRALEYYHDSLELFHELGNPPSPTSSTLNNIGQVYLQQGKFDQAENYFHQALELRRDLNSPSSLAESLQNMGDLHRQTGNSELALHYYRQANEVYEQTGNRTNQVDLHTSKAGIHMQTGDFERAYRNLNRAYRLDQQIRPGHYDPDLLRSLAEFHYETGSDSAFVYAEKLYESIENQRISIGASGRSRMDFFARHAPFYNEIASWHIQDRNDPKTAYRLVESAKARAFVDDMAEASAQLDATLDEQVRTEKAALESRVTELQSRLEWAGDESERKRLQKELREAELEYEALLTRLQLNHPSYVAFDYPEPIGLADAREMIDEDTVILEFATTDSTMLGFAITADRLITWQLPGSETPAMGQLDDLEQQVLSFREQIREKADLQALGATGRTLQQMLVAPARELLRNSERVIIVPDGPLAYLPFEALPYKDGYMVESFEIKYSPSMTALRHLQEPDADYEQDMLQVADPDFTERQQALTEGAGFQLASLPAARLEARTIGEMFDRVTRLSGADATEPRIREKDLTDYRYLHFATHGVLNERTPELSGLVLARGEEGTGGNPYAGFLRSADILALEMNSEMAVLSACQTGLGENIQGEGVLGLQRAFLHAGTSSVVVSLWGVYDHSTAVFMREFYSSLNEHRERQQGVLSELMARLGMGASQHGGSHAFSYRSTAMREAKLAMLEHEGYRHPAYWAPFVLIGR